jgi:lipopolysaccharide/colanic/teichoic acid biosynthesis glycosyltransferase
MTTAVSNIGVAEPQTCQGGDDLALLAAEVGIVGQAAVRRPIYEFSKRALDLTLALLALLVAVPVLIIVALAVRFSSRGPILFRQTRVGRYGRPFTCLKFRTMVKHAEKVLADDPDFAARFSKSYKLRQDHRVTRVGRILRKTSLDELPQLLNVIRGDMSLVGPRPVPAEELRIKYGPAASQVVSVRPGVTGLWQVSGRGATSYEERVRLDVSYVERRSLLLDLGIIARTPIALLTMRGAH